MGGEAPAHIVNNFDLVISWDVQSLLESSKEFSWNTGSLRNYWYRVQGSCAFPTSAGDGLGLGVPGGCEVLPIQTDDNKCVGALGGQQFIQTIMATDLSDLCDQMVALNWDWPIHSIKKWSRPAENSLVSSTDTCNELVDVPFCNVPDCLSFCLSADALIKINASAKVYDALYFYTGSGGMILSGEAHSRLTYKGTGGIVMGGRAPVTSTYYSYRGRGGIVMGGSAPIVSSSWSYRGRGGIIMGGHAPDKSSRWSYRGTGGVVMGGHAPAHEGYVWRPSGGIRMGGTAPTRHSNVLAYRGHGTIVMGGHGTYVSPDWHGSTSGGIVMGGTSPATVTPNPFYVGSGRISLGGTAPLGGSWKGILTATGQGSAEFVDEGPTFYDVEGEALVPPTFTINTNCGGCDALPLQLVLAHPLNNAAVLQDFLVYNGLSLPTSLSFIYNRLNSSWQSNTHLRGTNESWRIVFEWVCTTNLQSYDLGSSVWKFSMLVSRIVNGQEFDTRLMLAFPPDVLCAAATRRGFDFTFTVNTQSNLVSTNFPMDVQIHLIHDEIGLFKSKFWANNPLLKFRISEFAQPSLVERMDIKPIFPVPIPLG